METTIRIPVHDLEALAAFLERRAALAEEAEDWGVGSGGVPHPLRGWARVVREWLAIYPHELPTR